MQKAGRYTCRHDGVASILDFKLKLANRCSKEVKSGANRASIPDFKPRLANRCSHKVKTGAIRASILDFRPRLGNRCSKEVKTGAICASILDFKPRLANRCSQEVKTGAIPAAQGLKHYPADGECRMGRLGRGNSSVPAGITRTREPSAPGTKKRVPTHR